MAVARFPHGEVNYVMRGYEYQKKLIGIQNHNHRLWFRFTPRLCKKIQFVYVCFRGWINFYSDKPNYPSVLG